jgi:hypothetical protein
MRNRSAPAISAAPMRSFKPTMAASCPASLAASSLRLNAISSGSAVTSKCGSSRAMTPGKVGREIQTRGLSLIGRVPLVGAGHGMRGVTTPTSPHWARWRSA